jgi:hypothetical protein
VSGQRPTANQLLTRSVQVTVLNVESPSTLFLTKEVSYMYMYVQLPWQIIMVHDYHDTQVREISFHSMLSVIIRLVAVSGLESYAHWMSTWQAVASLSYHALMNAITGLKWLSYFVKT